MVRQRKYQNKEFIVKLGQRIREVRQERGLSQEELANLCDLELSHINRMELGKVNTSVSHLYLIAQKLGVTPSYLLDFEM